MFHRPITAERQPLAFTAEHGEIASPVLALRDRLRSQVLLPDDAEMFEPAFDDAREVGTGSRTSAFAEISMFEPAGADYAAALAYESGFGRVIDDIADEMDRHARAMVEGDSPEVIAERARLRRLAGLEG